MDSRHEFELSGPRLSEIRRALRRGSAECVLSTTFQDALRKLHDALIQVRSLGGHYSRIDVSPDLSALMERAGIVGVNSDPQGAARRRQPVQHGS